MRGKTVSPKIMRFAVVFIILFRISFGFHLHFGLDHILHGLEAGKAALLNFGKFHESKQGDRTHDSIFSKDSKEESDSSSEDPLETFDGSIVKDTLKTVVGDNLKTPTKIADGSVRGVENTLGTATRLESKAGSGGSVEAIVGTAGGAGKGIILDESSEIGRGAVRGLESTLQTASGRAGGAASSSAAASSSGVLARKAGGAASSSAAASSSGVAGKADGAASNSAAASSSGVVAGKADGAASSSAAASSSGVVTGRTSGAVSSSVAKSSSGAGKAGKVMSRRISMGTATGNEDEESEDDFLEDDLEIVPKRVRETSESRAASISGGSERGSREEIQKVPRAISSKLTENSLKTVITDVSVGEACNSKSVVTGFPSFPPVSKFVHIFIQGVEASELLTKLFNVTDSTALQFSQFKYRYITDVFRKLGFIDANDIAAASVRHIDKYFDVIVPQALVRVYANAFANYIFAEGFLTNDNAEQYAEMYIKAMEESSEGNGVICECDYNRNFQALGDGVFSFLLSVGEPSRSQAWEIAFYYAHEWLLAAVDYGSLGNPTLKK